MNNEFDSYAKNYQEKIDDSIGVFGKKHDFFVQDKLEKLAASFKEVGNLKELNVLDVGCGIGLGHNALRDKVASLTGVDVSEESIKLAVDNNPSCQYKTYDGKKLPFDDNTFDCVYAICVLHHVPKEQWEEFLSEMYRVIKPGGEALVIEHNPLNPATQWVVKTCELDKDAILLFPWKLKSLFQQAGANKLETVYTLFTPFEYAFFRGLDKLLCWLPFGAQYIVKGRK